MKKLTLLLSAIGLAFGATAASAEPAKQANQYYYITHNSDFIMFVPNAVETDGDSRSIWTINIFGAAQQGVEGLLALARIECSANTYAITRLEAVTAEGAVPLADTGSSQAVQDGSPIAVIRDLVCTGDASSLTPLTGEEAAELTVRYRESATQ